MTFRQRMRLRLASKRFLQSQLDEWRLAHVRWSREKRQLQDLLRRAEEKNRNQTVIADTLPEVARIVAESWLGVAKREGWVETWHALTAVIAALEGFREPEVLGLDPGSDEATQIVGITDQDPNPIQNFSRFSNFPDD